MNQINIKLLNDFLESKTDLQQATKRNYMNTYERLINILLSNNKRKSLLTLTQKEVLDKVDKLMINNGTNPATYNSKIDYLKLYKYLLQFNKKPISKIDKKIDKYIKINDENKPKTNQNLINDSNMTFKTLNDLLLSLDGQAYLIYYILINYNVRNQDLLIEYTDNKKLINDVNKGKVEQNIIYKSKDHFIYVRSDYKTNKIYGIKKHIINDDKFIEIMNQKEVNKALLLTNKDAPYKNNQISNLIKGISNKYKPNSGLTQALIYKIINNHYEMTNDHKKLLQISDNRGHNLDTQKSQYSSIQ